MFDIIELNGMKVTELQETAEKLNIKNFKSLKKQELIYRILDEQAVNPIKLKEEPKKEDKPSEEKEGKRKTLLKLTSKIKEIKRTRERKEKERIKTPRILALKAEIEEMDVIETVKRRITHQRVVTITDTTLMA